MKKEICFIIFLSVSLLGAALLQNIPQLIEQPDGKIQEAFVTGDEYFHRVHDANGYTIVRHPKTGYAVYAVPEGNSLRASEYIAGRVDPADLGILPNLFLAQKQIDRTVEEIKENRNSGSRGLPVGIMNNIVVFVRFQDQDEFPDTPAFSFYGNLHNQLGVESLRDYYNEVSSGQLTITSGLFPPADAYGTVVSIVTDNPRAYYSPYNEVTNPIGYTAVQHAYRLRMLCREIAIKADSYIPEGLDYDNDDDGSLDAVTFIFRGGVDGWGDLLWPTFYSFGVVSECSINGINLTHAVFQFETSIGVSVLCHEMGHMIGYPDFYHYNDTPVDATANWDLMSWGDRVHSLTYNKWKYGTWFTEIPLITPTSTPTTYTLTAIDLSPYSCYRIESTNPDQFYVLEYRRQAGRYESHVPGTGLIIYRIITTFDGEPLNGNAEGPPDEVYIYRPGGTVNINGDHQQAHYASTYGRTAIHNYTDPKPWLYVDDYTTPDGNLAITDIGPAGGNTISFVVRQEPPHVWSGEVSANWNVIGNWKNGTVPNSTKDVIIPSDVPNYPATLSSQAYCKSIRVESGASVTVNAYNINVTQDAVFFGNLNMSSGSDLLIGGDVFWEAGSSVNVTNPGAELFCGGDMTFKPESDVQFSLGTVNFNGTGTCYLSNFSNNTVLYNLKNNVSYPQALIFDPTSTFDFFINGYFHNFNGKYAYSNFDGLISVNGDLIDYNTTGLGLIFNSGSLRLGGSSQVLCLQSPSDYINNLGLYASGTVTLSSNLTLKGYLLIGGGIFNAGGNTITLGGNWKNLAGPAAFNEGSSRVVFNGTGHQYCERSEDFNILEVNCGAALRINSSSVTVTCAAYDWTAGGIDVLSGIFTAYDLLDDGIRGNWYLNPVADINLTNSDGPVHLNGNLFIYGGHFNVYGGTALSYWPYSANASITMTGGILDFKNQGIYIYNSPTYTLTTNISGGTIRTSSHFVGNRYDFNPTGGIIELYGGSEVLLSHGTGSSLNIVQINKASARQENTDTNDDNAIRTNCVTATSNLVIRNYLWIMNGTMSAPDLINISGNWIDSAAGSGFNAGTGWVIFDGSGTSVCYGESFANLRLNKTGAGQLQIANDKTVTCTVYDWESGTLTVNGGSFTALDIMDEAVLGTVNLNAGMINFHQLGSQYLDLCGIVNISGGEMHLYGGVDSSWWPYNGNAELHMSGGLLEVHDAGIYINPANDLVIDVTGGIIRTASYFQCNRSDFNPAGGTLELNSSADASITMNYGTLHKLLINKTSERTVETDPEPYLLSDRHGNPVEHTRTNTVSLNTNLTCRSDLTIVNGTLNFNGYTVFCTDNVVINGGTLDLNAGAKLYMSDNKYLKVNAGGTLKAIGVGNNKALIAGLQGYFYPIVEANGTIAAQNAEFEHYAEEGINLKAGALVDEVYSFNFCTFKSGKANGTCLTMDSNQNLLISGAVFESNTWGGIANVTKHVNAGMVNFANATGGFAGEAYDNDIYDRIIWNTPGVNPDLRIVKAQWSQPMLPLGETAYCTVTCLNNSTAACGANWLDIYCNRTTSPPLYLTGDQSIRLSSVPAGIPQDYTFAVTNISFSGNWFSYLQIDRNNEIAEANEGNNVFGYFNIVWVALPSIADLTIEYLEATGQVRLDWSYPVATDIFNIYRSADPYFTPAPENRVGQAEYPITEYMEPAAGNRYFYIVKAEVLSRAKD